MEDLRRDFSCGDYTQRAVEARLDIDVTDDPGAFPEDGKAYIAEQRSRKNFLRKIVEHLQKQGHDVSYNDTQEILKILMDYSQEANLFTYLPPKERKNTFKRWLNEGSPERERAYQLCFALKMDAAEVDDFFLKGYMQRSFNYKDPREAIYYYCFRKGLSYAYAQGLLEEYQSHLNRCCAGSEVETIVVGRAISEIDTDEQLLEYLYLHRYEAAQQNLTITNRIKELIEECKPLAQAEYEYYRSDFTDSDEHNRKRKKMNSMNALLTQITGFDEVTMRDYNLEKVLSEEDQKRFDEEKLAARLKKQRKAFEEVVGKNFPAKDTLSAIEKGRVIESTEKLYKALVLLEFYSFYGTLFNASLKAYQCGQSLRAPDSINYMIYADEFKDVLDDSLARCGYGSAYDLNPYIEPFLICAGCQNPLNTFREFIDDYYLGTHEPPVEMLDVN